MQFLQCTITTSDLQLLKSFYIDTFGFKQIREWSKPEEGRSGIKIQRNNIVIEIMETKNIKYDTRSPSLDNKGWSMIGIEVENVDKTIDVVLKNGGKLHSGPTPGKTTKFIAFISDPDNNLIELIQLDKTVPLQSQLKIDDYNRNELWSTGNITPDLELFEELAINNFWNCKLDKSDIEKSIKKAGDICGCPVPDKVMKREGYSNALLYLLSLSHDFKLIKNILNCIESPFRREWGKEEIKDIKNEPWGEDCSRIPKEILSNNTVRGPGKYQEFSITRLMWIDKNEMNIEKQLGLNKIKEIIINSKSIDDLQIDLINHMAEKRYKLEPINETINHISKGICHEGFFKQENVYIQLESVYKKFKVKYSDKSWFPSLETKIQLLINSPITPFS